jgi:hypothetical protein
VITPWLENYTIYLKLNDQSFTVLLDNPDDETVEKCIGLEIDYKIFKMTHEPFLEDFILKYCCTMTPDWIVRLDADEWISVENLRILETKSKTLNKSKVYGISRKWVFVDCERKVAFHSNFVNSELGLDYQYRLFHNAGVVPNFRCHTPGVLSSEFRLIREVEMFHLVWQLKDLKRRSEDQLKYSRLAGMSESHFRFCYVPEENLNPKWSKYHVDKFESLMSCLKKSVGSSVMLRLPNP